MKKSHLLLTILFIGLSFTIAEGQTQFNSSGSVKQNNTCTGTTQTLSNFTVPAGDDVLLVVAITGSICNATSYIPIVTYNGQTLTFLVQMSPDRTNCNGYCVRTYQYYLKLGDVATDITSDIDVNWDDPDIFLVCHKTLTAAIFTNVNQTTPLNNQDSVHHADGTTAPSLDITSTAGDMVMDVVIGKNGGSIAQFTPSANQTKIKDLSVKPSSSSALNRVRVATSYELSTSTTTTMSWTVPSSLYCQMQYGINIQSAGQLLPVELVHFQAIESTEKVVLNWQTASERINEGFEIERSTNGETWENIGFVAGHGTTNEPQDYTFSDYQPIIGKSYYRLKQLDYDPEGSGAFEYSDIVTVNYENGVQNVNIQLFPNPVGDELKIVDGQGIATIYNLIGQPVGEYRISNKEYRISTQNLPNGQYILQIRKQDGMSVSKQFVKN